MAYLRPSRAGQASWVWGLRAGVAEGICHLPGPTGNIRTLALKGRLDFEPSIILEIIGFVGAICGKLAVILRRFYANFVYDAISHLLLIKRGT